MGLCDTIVPSVDFNTSIPPKDSWKYWTLVEEGTANGLVNGMKLLIDVEAYNHGSDAKSSGGAAFIIHHHRDHPIMQLSGGLSTAAGSEIGKSSNKFFRSEKGTEKGKGRKAKMQKYKKRKCNCREIFSIFAFLCFCISVFSLLGSHLSTNTKICLMQKVKQIKHTFLGRIYL